MEKFTSNIFTDKENSLYETANKLKSFFAEIRSDDTYYFSNPRLYTENNTVKLEITKMDIPCEIYARLSSEELYVDVCIYGKQYDGRGTEPDEYELTNAETFIFDECDIFDDDAIAFCGGIIDDYIDDVTRKIYNKNYLEEN